MPYFKTIAMYILGCADGSLYVGVTNNPKRRLQEHQDGINVTAYTYSRRPVKMLYIEYFLSGRKAIAREKQIKGWTHQKKMALIAGDMKKLKALAECKNASHSSTPLRMTSRFYDENNNQKTDSAQNDFAFLR